MHKGKSSSPISPTGCGVLKTLAAAALISVAGGWGVRPAHAVGDPVKLNPPFASDYEGVLDFQIAPDGSTVVYLVNEPDPEFGAEFLLFSRPIGGGTPVQLNAPLGEGSGVLNFSISPDSSRVVYHALMAFVDEHGVGRQRLELFSVPIGGGTAIKLNPTLIPGGNVIDFTVSPGGDRVVYRADQIFDQTFELFSVPIGGGSAVRINAPLSEDGDVIASFSVSPDGDRVVYRAITGLDLVGDSVIKRAEMFSVPIGGGASIKLNGPLVAGGRVEDFSISADGAQVVYLADQETDDVPELFSVPIGGGTAVKLNGPLVAGGDVLRFSISPDSARVVYLADQEALHVNELFSVPIGGGTAVKLNAPLATGGRVGRIEHDDFDGFLISPDGSRVVYIADQETNGVFELFSVPIEGGSTVKLNGPLVGGGEVGTIHDDSDDFSISPDGARVVYLANQEHGSVIELFSVPIGGGTAVKLNAPLVVGQFVVGDVDGFSVTPDGSKVVYRADQDTDEIPELFVVPIGGGSAVRLNDPLVGVAWVRDFAISSDGARVAFVVDRKPLQDGHPGLDSEVSLNELFSVSIDGGPDVLLSDPASAFGNVSVFSFAGPNGGRVAYIADQESEDVFELFSVPIGGGAPIKLNGPLGRRGDVVNFSISPDGSRAVYRTRETSITAGLIHSFNELFSVPIEGGTAVKLNPPLAAERAGVRGSWISPDGARVVFLSDQDVDDNVVELFSVPIGGGTAIKLADLSDVRRFTDLLISANGEHLVFLFDRIELFSVPVEGGGVVKLGNVRHAHNDFADFLITPDGGRVVYRDDQDIDGVLELFSTPISGGTSVKVNGPLVAGGDVFRFSISPDGARVVYRADQETNDVLELFSVPIGGGTAVKLNGPLVEGGSVGSIQDNHDAFSISPDGARVVYRADQETNDVLELFSVPIAGGTPIKLNPPLVVDGDVVNFSIGPDGARVVYRANQERNEIVELFSVPIAGGAAVKLNGSLIQGPFSTGRVLEFSIGPDAGRVIYRADQEINDVFELFSVPIGGGTAEKVNGPLVEDGEIRSFLLSPDGGRVVYRADQDIDDVFELFSVSLDSAAGNWTAY